MRKTLLFVVVFILILSSCTKTKKTYWSKGVVKSETHYKDGKIHGTYMAWFPNGKKEMEFHYNNGALDGVSKIWHYSGHLKSEENYCMGKKCGTFTYYKYNGLLERRMNYENDTLNGLFTEWHKDVDVKLKEGKYKNGLYDGKWLFWNVFEDLVAVGDFESGNGEIKHYDDYGTLTLCSIYKNNEEDSIIYISRE